MTTPAKPLDLASSISDPEGSADLFMIAIPMPTYKVISDAAAKQGMTFAQFLGKAVGEYIHKTESTSGSNGPKLLLG
jgi:hypothetical protein